MRGAEVTFFLRNYRRIELAVLKFLSRNKKPEQMKLIHYPDPRLEVVCEPCSVPPTEYEKSVADRLIDEMLKYDGISSKWLGVGMSANQLGILKRVMVYCPMNPSNRMRVVRYRNMVKCFNPEIISTGRQINSDYEGCLSDQKIFKKVNRNNLIEVKYMDEHGKVHKERLSGWGARVFQHEMDHLSGKLCRSR